jgi:hypothetical protein
LDKIQKGFALLNLHERLIMLVDEVERDDEIEKGSVRVCKVVRVFLSEQAIEEKSTSE